jgi:hypothetical protein
MSGLFRRLREWSWNHSKPVTVWNPQDRRFSVLVVRRLRKARRLIARPVSAFVFAIADRYDRDPRRCWMKIAMWAMGFDGYSPLDVVDPGCDWCGKCQKQR